MKEYALELARSKDGYNAKLNAMREYLQAYVLRIMHIEGVFASTAFVGGTALRFLHNLPRFSEDLDFSAVKNEGFDFSAVIKKIKSDLSAAGYAVSIGYNDVKTVRYAMVKFERLMREAGLSPHEEQKFSIKIEIDTNPPGGAVYDTVITNKYFPLSFLTYDLPSLFAGKLHALLNRKYTKGRDFFDIGWYLSRWKTLVPNLTLLDNALMQTGWKGTLPSSDNWRGLVHDAVKKADWKKVIADAEGFLENPADMDIFTKENILKLIAGKGN